MRRRALLWLALLAPLARWRAGLYGLRLGRDIELRGGWILKKGER